jgi:hypothetical protein
MCAVLITSLMLTGADLLLSLDRLHTMIGC